MGQQQQPVPARRLPTQRLAAVGGRVEKSLRWSPIASRCDAKIAMAPSQSDKRVEGVASRVPAVDDEAVWGQVPHMAASGRYVPAKRPEARHQPCTCMTRDNPAGACCQQ